MYDDFNQQTTEQALVSSSKSLDVNMLIYIASGCLASVLFIIGITICICYAVRLYKRKFNEDLLNLCQPDDLVKSNLLLKYDELEKQTELLLNDDEYAQVFTSDFIANTFEDEVRENGRQTVEIRTCRYPQLHCLMNSMVHLHAAAKFTLHMNKFNDFYNRPLYLSQAPLEDEFPLYWQAIVQEKIGVVVWVGQFAENDEEQMLPYVSMRKLGILEINRYKILTERILPNIDDDIDVIETNLTITRHSDDKADMISRKVIFIHFYVWPSEYSDEQLSKLNRCVIRISKIHKCQSVKLPGLLFHCTNGVESSATLCALYIAHQMWLEKRVLNLVGVMRYVRNFRHCSFSVRNEAFKHVQTVFGSMKLLASGQ